LLGTDQQEWRRPRVTETRGTVSAARLSTCRVSKAAVSCVDPLATRIALRRGRLAALSSQGRARRQMPPSVAARPTRESDEQSRAPAGRVGLRRRTTDRRRAGAGTLPTRASTATPPVAVAFLRCGNLIVVGALYWTPAGWIPFPPSPRSHPACLSPDEETPSGLFSCHGRCARQ
jgi:hypothetical protein